MKTASIPHPAPVKPLSDIVLEEVNYAASLYERAAEALDKELACLLGAGVRIDCAVFWRASNDLSICSSALKLLAIDHQIALNAKQRAEAAR